jgi:16S rRNA (guanine527-N7)-methyltransferase
MISLRKYWNEAHRDRAQFGAYENISDTIVAFSDLFLKWNKSINLSAARDQSAVAEHIADCFYLVAQVPLGCLTLLDVGAGGGLPGVLLAIARPEIRVLSLEPVHKKHAFLRTCARELKLPNYDAFAERLEDHRGSGYDAAVSRATWELGEWLDRGATYVRTGGVVLGMEAVSVVVLNDKTARYPYEFLDKTRAIIVRTVG